MKSQESSKEKLATFRQSFLQHCQDKLSSGESEELWQQISNSLAYTFNKAHAVAYSYLSYYFAYLKANYFSSLITYFLDHSWNSPAKTLAYLREAIFWGFTPRKPDINFSEVAWRLKNQNLWMGFSSLKNFQPTFFAKVVAARQEKKKGCFENWEDFLQATSGSWKDLDLATFRSWIELDLFASLKVETGVLWENSENIFRYCQLKERFSKAWRFLPPLAWPKLKSAKLTTKLKEFESWKIYFSYFLEWKNKKKVLPLRAFTNLANLSSLNPDKRKLIVYAVLQEIKFQGNSVFLTLFDLYLSFKLGVSKVFYQQNQKLLVTHQALVFHLLVEIDQSKGQKILIEKVEG